jgi:hypothetical protein
MGRPIALGFLVFFQLFLAAGGTYGGISMLLDPSGGALERNDVLPSLPVPDYTLPGLFLLVVMGAVPRRYVCKSQSGAADRGPRVNAPAGPRRVLRSWTCLCVPTRAGPTSRWRTGPTPR